MSAQVTIHDSIPGELRVELRQAGGEVVTFLIFVIVILVALYVLVPAAREAPGLLLALLGITTGWSVVAISAREIYGFSDETGTIDVLVSSLLGDRRRRIAAREVTAVRVTTGGPDDNRRLVELLVEGGKQRLRLPARLTTLTDDDQLEIARVIATQLRVPLRGAS